MLAKETYEALADLRYRLRRFLKFSEMAAKRVGLTPQQHQLMLQIEGYPGRDWATPTELAERLQITHHACLGLINRAADMHLVGRREDPDDRRLVQVHLLPRGRQLLSSLSEEHLIEIKRLIGHLDDLV